MIGIIKVTLQKGELAGAAQLREIASHLYPQEASEEAISLSPGSRQYIKHLSSVYTCEPRNAARAFFLWSDAQEFEVVLETSYQGHLLKDVEGVVRRLDQRLQQLRMVTTIRVELREPADAQLYIVGSTARRAYRVWNHIRDNVVALIIALLLLLGAKLWLPEYFQEAIASVIALTLFLLWQLVRSLAGVLKTNVEWSIHE